MLLFDVLSLCCQERKETKCIFLLLHLLIQPSSFFSTEREKNRISIVSITIITTDIAFFSDDILLLVRYSSSLLANRYPFVTSDFPGRIRDMEK